MVGFRSGDSHFLQQNAQFGQLNVIPSLPPANEVCEGYVFTGVCPGGVSVWGGSLSREGSLSRRPPITAMRGRYASYWNAFLFNT